MEVCRISLVTTPLVFPLHHWFLAMESASGDFLIAETSRVTGAVRYHRRPVQGPYTIVASTTDPRRMQQIVDRFERMLGHSYALLSLNCERVAKTAFYGPGAEAGNDQAALATAALTGGGLLWAGAGGPVALGAALFAAFVVR